MTKPGMYMLWIFCFKETLLEFCQKLNISSRFTHISNHLNISQLELVISIQLVIYLNEISDITHLENNFKNLRHPSVKILYTALQLCGITPPVHLVSSQPVEI